MMDLHSLVIITCVFLTSLLSLLFINKFFRRKTFEEIIAEKKALTDKIYAQSKVKARKPKKLQQTTKKDLKRERKKLLLDKQKDQYIEQEDSDAQSEQPWVENEHLAGISTVHVEFDPDPEVIVDNTPEDKRRVCISEREKESFIGGSSGDKSKQKIKKEKRGKSSGILINKDESAVLKEKLKIEEPINTFELRQPKDMIELKKSDKKDCSNRKEKHAQKEKTITFEKPNIVICEKQQLQSQHQQVQQSHLQPQQQEPSVEPVAYAPTDMKQQEEKLRQGAPKIHAGNNNIVIANTKIKQNKKLNKETAGTKELIALDKLSEADTVGVSLLMNLFRRAELNRFEIQILIDYLLNKQQDTPATHSEWSDDISQKLKRQLEEKEKALAEEQEASMGIQAKLREMRTEINTERAQLNASIKVYVEKMQSKDQEIAALNQEMQALNEKFSQERKQFQAKLLLEKQNGSQDIFAQLQRIKTELVHKDKCINDLTCLVNACQQANEDFKQQVNLMEKQREELEKISNSRIYEIENVRALEVENSECKIELHNLKNAHETLKSDFAQVHHELDAAMARNTDLDEKQKLLASLQNKNEVLQQQLAGINGKAAEQLKEQSGLEITVVTLKTQLAEKERQMVNFHSLNAELLQKLNGLEAQTKLNSQNYQDLQKFIESLQQDVASKNQQLQQAEQTIEKLRSREKEFSQQLHDQKTKNDDLRKKNWKLVEALQSSETTAKQITNTSTSENPSLARQQKQLSATASAFTIDQKSVCEIFQRLYPEAVKSCSSASLNIPFDQWIERVLTTQVKLAATANAPVSISNKSTQSADIKSNINNSSSNHNSSNNYNAYTNTNTLTNDVDRLNDKNCNYSRSRRESDGGDSANELHIQNTQLRAKVDELTKLVTKTSITLSALEGHARQEHEKWQSILLSKEEEISRLQLSNGVQGNENDFDYRLPHVPVDMNMKQTSTRMKPNDLTADYHMCQSAADSHSCFLIANA